ncbi:hypothetical protein OJ252_1328 [Cryptosporidium canis]|uniref:START domain-containing protein n=1 Tax=Cryptosporidium canis TaxID=195482 RepID=A0ABQ8P9H1_9CRYT|nr:hypothetical protein OJ252_1328 [Cryptosporidium canis]
MRHFRKAFGILSHLEDARRRRPSRRWSFGGASESSLVETGSENHNKVVSSVAGLQSGGVGEKTAPRVPQDALTGGETQLSAGGEQVGPSNELDLKIFRIVSLEGEDGSGGGGGDGGGSGGVVVPKVVGSFNLEGVLMATTTTSCNSPLSLRSFGRPRREFDARLGSGNGTPVTTSLDFQSDENSRSLSNVYNAETECPRAGDGEVEFLELMYEEVLRSYTENLPYAAYSKFLELCGLLFELVERRVGAGKSVLLEMSLELSHQTDADSADAGNQNSSSSTQPASAFHQTLRSLKFSSSRGSTTSHTATPDSSKGRLLLDLVHLNRNGVPIRTPSGGSSSSNGSSGSGSSRKWRYHIGGSCSSGGNAVSNGCKTSGSESCPQQSLGSRRGKLFLESFPLLPQRSAESGDLAQGMPPEGAEAPSPRQRPRPNSKLIRLEDFPCIIFSQNCLPVSNSRFSSVKDRNLALEFLKFPTEVRCLGLERETRLSEFIVRLVTNMHIHRLRFTLFKCSTSYTDLVLALRYKRRHCNSRKSEEQQQQQQQLHHCLDERHLQTGVLSSEWNSLGDSNMGMWWTMGTESEFLILCDYIVNTNPINVVSIVNECDLHLKWAPFVTSSECLAYVGLYNQLVRNYSNMPWPIGLCQCSLYCVAIDVNRQEDEDSEPCIIITAVSLPEKADSVCGIKVKEAQSNASKLDILSLCFVIQSVPNCPSQTRISFLSKSNMPIPSFVPKAVPSFIAKQIGKAFFNNLIGIIERFSSSPFYQRIKSDTEFYEFVKRRLNVLEDSEFDMIQDPSPIRKKTQKEIKQREELKESLSRKDTRNHPPETAPTNGQEHPNHPKRDISFGNSRSYSAARTMMRMFPTF